MEDVNKIDRRSVIKGLGTGLAAVTISPLLAGQSAERSSVTATGPEDPIGKYPKPPFNSQSQPWPGLAGKMNPKPDHGEKTYKGSGRLAGRKALITGGDSGHGKSCSDCLCP